MRANHDNRTAHVFTAAAAGAAMEATAAASGDLNDIGIDT
jgi:hypothetical protein